MEKWNFYLTIAGLLIPAMSPIFSWIFKRRAHKISRWEKEQERHSSLVKAASPLFNNPQASFEKRASLEATLYPQYGNTMCFRKALIVLKNEDSFANIKRLVKYRQNISLNKRRGKLEYKPFHPIMDKFFSPTQSSIDYLRRTAKISMALTAVSWLCLAILLVYSIRTGNEPHSIFTLSAFFGMGLACLHFVIFERERERMVSIRTLTKLPNTLWTKDYPTHAPSPSKSSISRIPDTAERSALARRRNAS